MGYAQHLREQGIEQGIHMGLRRVVRRLLIERFGPLPESIETRLTNASAEQLDAWGLNLIKAKTLDEVFADES
ncbi:MAG: DUF4351 domain-containing protein [Candidatus Competibacterales bacterium]